MLDAIGGLLPADDPAFRLNLVGSQFVGVVMARAVLGVEPLASMPARSVAEVVAPSIVQYLVGPLDVAAR